MRTFYETGRFGPADSGKEVELDVRFRVADAAVMGTVAVGLVVVLKALGWAWGHGLFGFTGLAAACAVCGAYAVLRQAA